MCDAGRAVLSFAHALRSGARRVVTWPNLGPFDFPDLDVCLRLVDRSDHSGEVFLSRAKALVQPETTHPKEFRRALHLQPPSAFIALAGSPCARPRVPDCFRIAALMPLVAASWAIFLDHSGAGRNHFASRFCLELRLSTSRQLRAPW